ncbi:MAG: YqgE/AlgH family protein [Bacteroidales bacterium]|nr:YqgE/AlgH family protein [Bacteroidales bacterium]
MSTLQEKLFDAPMTGNLVGKGKLLVSVPLRSDGYFDRTVIMIIGYDREGAMGFILNRPMHVYLQDLMPQYKGFRNVLYNGGPVGLDSVFYIHRYNQMGDSEQQLMEGLYYGGSESEIRSLMSFGMMDDDHIRFFAGYAGWSAGQLEQELAKRIWVVAEMRRKYLDVPSDRLWRSVVHDLGESYSSWLEIPDRASYN